MIIHKAIAYAAYAHRNQLRKGTNIPYIAHLTEVYGILCDNGCSKLAKVGGLLHDTVEDTAVTLSDIEREFGHQVAEIIAYETEDKTLPWMERKQTKIAELATAPIEAQQICCADKLSNIRSIYVDTLDVGEDVWKRFNGTKDQTNWYYHSIVQALTSLDGTKMYNELIFYVNYVFDSPVTQP